MLKMLTASTEELEDAQQAVAEILEQLNLEKYPMGNKAGFITCSFDFIETGILEAIGKALPFDLVGCTTLTNATGNQAGSMLLCLTVLVSDTCHFSVIASDSLAQGLHEPIAGAYQRGVAALPSEPALILAFIPMMRQVGGELILNALDAIAGGIPIFGTIGCDHDTSEYTHTYTLYNGQSTADSLCLLLISGDIHPRFYLASASEDKIQKQKALITASEGSVLQKVNNLSTKQYLQTLGLTKGDGVEGMSAIPFIVNYNDGTPPSALAIYMLTPEGYAVCGGAMPVGATLSIGSIDYEDILATAEQTLAEVLAGERLNGILIFSCLGRNLVLGTDILAEINVVRASIPEQIPYHLSYAGGEICPVYNQQNQSVNRFHNFTFIVCVF